MSKMGAKFNKNQAYVDLHVSWKTDVKVSWKENVECCQNGNFSEDKWVIIELQKKWCVSKKSSKNFLHTFSD